MTTPTTQMVDLGTEFAVAVAPGADVTQVAVISGEVQVGTNITTVLRTGQSADERRDQVRWHGAIQQAEPADHASHFSAMTAIRLHSTTIYWTIGLADIV